MMFLRNKYFFPNKDELKTNVSWYFDFFLSIYFNTFLFIYLQLCYNCLAIPILEKYIEALKQAKKNNCLINTF